MHDANLESGIGIPVCRYLRSPPRSATAIWRPSGFEGSIRTLGRIGEESASSGVTRPWPRSSRIILPVLSEVPGVPLRPTCSEHAPIRCIARGLPTLGRVSDSFSLPDQQARSAPSVDGQQPVIAIESKAILRWFVGMRSRLCPVRRGDDHRVAEVKSCEDACQPRRPRPSACWTCRSLLETASLVQ